MLRPWLAALLLAAGALIPPQAQACAEQLFGSIAERLGYIEEMALHKHLHSLPVEDLEREAVVLERAAAAAQAAGLDPAKSEQFFRAQINASKTIQFRYRADLLAGDEAPEPRDLVSEIRPALLELGDRIIGQLAGCAAQPGALQSASFEQFSAAVSERYLSEADKRRLHAALLAAAD